MGGMHDIISIQPIALEEELQIKATVFSLLGSHSLCDLSDYSLHGSE